MAVIAALCFGVTFWGLGFVTPRLGGVLTTWETRVVGPILLLAVARPFKQSLRPPTRTAWPWIVAVGLIDSLAFLSYNFGVRSADSGLVSVISSLFSAVTVLLARLFLNEKLAPNQWAGIGLILLGIGLVSAG